MNLSKIVIVSDLDGTFLNYDGSLPNNSKEFFSLIKNDTFIVATSRHINNILTLKIPVENNYYAICSDGAFVAKIKKNKYEVIAETLLNQEKIHIFNTLKLLKKEFFIFTGMNNNFIIYHISKNNIKINLEMIVNIPNETREIITIDIDNLKDVKKVLSSDIRSITLFVDNKQSKNIFKQIPDFIDSQKIIYDETRVNLNYSWIDIIPKKTNKYFGLKTLLKKEQINKKIFAFGNGENDIDFFDLADKKYVPYNAIDELKQKATYISTEYCGDNFITDILKELNKERMSFNE